MQKYCACHTKRLSTRYQTGWNVTKCRACHANTTWQLAWKPSKRRGAAASPTGTARPRENQRLETRHVGASKRAFRARLPPIFTLCSFKIDVFLRVFLRTGKFATSKSMFRARLPSLFITSHKMPRLPRNLHLVATWRSPDNAIRKNTQHDTSKVLRLPQNDDGHVQSAAPATKNATHLLRASQKYCACHTKRLSTRYKTTSECHEVPRLPCEMKQHDVWNLQKRPLLQNLP